MIFDFNSAKDSIPRDEVGAKFYNLYWVRNNLELAVPEAFCISNPGYDRTELERRIDQNKKYAVRSSSNQEDSVEGSAAGIFRTYLNIQGSGDIEKAIQNCFDSVNNEEVSAYLRQTGRDGSDLRISVIVQEMIQPEIAGVIFTANPVTGGDEYVIESTEGIAEAILEGTKSPRTTIVKKTDSPGSEIHAQLIDAAQSVADNFGDPQDIEWAYADDKIYILQARPITSLGKIHDPARIWTRANIGEILPKPLTPLSWDIFEKVIFNSYRFGYYAIADRILMNFVHLVPREWPRIKSPSLFGGHAYLNFDTILVTFSFEPWVDTEILKIGLGFDFSGFNLNRSKKLSTRLIVTLKKIQYMFELLFPRFSFERKCIRYVQGRVTKNQNAEDLGTLLKNASFVFGWHIAATARSFASLGFMKKRMKGKFSSQALSGFLSKGMNQEFIQSLNRLKGIIAKDPELLEKIKNENIADYKLWSGHEAFISNFSDFLVQYGHKSENEFELSQKSWADDPSLLKNMLTDIVPPIPRTTHGTTIDNSKIDNLYHAFQIREKLKDMLISEYRKIGKFYKKVGSELNKKGLLDSADDIFFLQLDEVENREKLNREAIMDAIGKRKLAYSQACKRNVPGLFYGAFPDTSESLQTGNHKAIVQGLGCSGGIIVGKAVQIDHLNEEVNFQKGDILVTYATNPGWTPLFALAGGVVTEIGGMLSHTATIAREYGIPMITSVTNIKNSIRDGEIIEINGSSGIIRKLKQSPANA